LRARGRIRHAILQNRECAFVGVVVSQGKKDGSGMQPGHLFLDRVDSTLFALPVIYIWLKLTV
jgi:predicted CDP-diglyceride synthetase/phosphatidate cytidylyltransferase